MLPLIRVTAAIVLSVGLLWAFGYTWDREMEFANRMVFILMLLLMIFGANHIIAQWWDV